MYTHPIVLPDNNRDENLYFRAVDQLVKRLELLLAPNISSIPGQYGPLPLSSSIFAYGLARAIDAIGSPRGIHFLDVGAGIGTKLLLAKMMYPDLICEGIESHPEVAMAAWKTLEGMEPKVHHADAFEWDEYDRFNIVYMYRPCSDWDMEERLERRVMGCMRERAILFLVGGQVEPESPWECISGSVWRKA